MSAPLQLFSTRNAPFVDQKGRLTPEAIRSLNELLSRVGGTTAITINELAITDDDDSGLEEFKAEVWKALATIEMKPFPQDQVVLQALVTELNGLREHVAVLAQQINDLKQGTTL